MRPKKKKLFVVSAYLIFPSLEKMECVANMEGLDETSGSANHSDGTPLTTILSGSCFPLLECPAQKIYQFNSLTITCKSK
jgi:hypothetical protein